jgi:DNA-binding transcriptional regulator YiaG
MTPANHRALRARLGLTVGAEARLLGVDTRTVERWLAGTRDIPPPAQRLLWLLDASHDRGRVDVLTDSRE